MKSEIRSRGPGKVVTAGKANVGMRSVVARNLKKRRENWKTFEFGVEIIDGYHFFGLGGKTEVSDWNFRSKWWES